MQRFVISEENREKLIHNTRGLSFKETNLQGKREFLKENFGYSYDEIDDEVKRLIELAQRYRGKVFGGFVRDFIVPKERFNANTDLLDFKDLDFWFRSKVDARRFLNELMLMGGNQMEGYPQDGYFVPRAMYLTVYKNNPFIYIDIVVHEQYPVNDFSVNLLSWDGVTLEVNKLHYMDGNEILTAKTGYTLEHVCKQIKNKSYDVSTEFMDSALGDVDSSLRFHSAWRILSFGPKFNKRHDAWTAELKEEEEEDAAQHIVHQAYDQIDNLELSEEQLLMLAILIISRFAKLKEKEKDAAQHIVHQVYDQIDNLGLYQEQLLKLAMLVVSRLK